ncbi:MAG TPA: glycosyltransferase family 2 protein [Candidatus Baltobacteraceae bacterium]|nr:glycosyltransferase family 2 protein [Candidatus Baltobacteraceae bacterium]
MLGALLGIDVVAWLRAPLVLELVAGLRALARMVATSGGKPLDGTATLPARTVAVIVPVLNEERRLAPALEALRACGEEIAEIVVVDGGSADATRAVARAAAERDPRIRVLDAPAAPRHWNGKAWNLETGLRATDAPWIATIDADVRVGPGILAAAIARAEREGLAALSVATRQRLADAGGALLHPAMLATLVYRYGLPNVVATKPAEVQANGQLFVARRDALLAADAFAIARASRCEDVTAARALAAHGGRIGFFEGDATVRMHDSWRDCAANWPRSLALHDTFTSPARTWLSLIEAFFAQALPLPTLIALVVLRHHIWFAHTAIALAAGLVCMRLGVLVGTRRAYVDPPAWYWLSPLADLPAFALIAAAMLRRRHVWRGRTLVLERR